MNEVFQNQQTKYFAEELTDFFLELCFSRIFATESTGRNEFEQVSVVYKTKKVT